jgi:CHAT domain-containing protein
MFLFGTLWVQMADGQVTEHPDTLYCRLQTRLEVGAALAMAKSNVAAIDTLKQALADFPQQLDAVSVRLLGEYHFHIGYAAFYKSLAAASEEDNLLANGSLRLADSLVALVDSKASNLRARISRMRGMFTYFMEGNAVDAQVFYEGAYRTWLLVPQKDSVEIAVVLQCMGQAATRQGEYERAIDLYRQSLEIREEIFGHIHARVGKAYWDLGNAYGYSDRYKEAAQAFQTAIDILKVASPGDQLIIANIMTNLAAADIELGEYQAAVTNMNTAISIKRKGDAYYAPELVKFFSILAVSLAHQSKFSEADRAISEIAEICKQNHLTVGAEVAHLWFAKARVLALSPTSQALAFAAMQKAMEAITQGKPLDDWRAYPDINATTEPMLLQQIILDKSNLLSALGRRAGSDSAYLQSSLQGYELAAGLSDRLRMEYEDQDDKLFLSGRGSLYLQDALGCAFDLWNGQHDEDYANRAFQLMENCKFQLLLDFFRKSRIQGSDGVGKSALTQLDALRRRCTELDFLLALPDLQPDSLKNYQAELLDKRIQQSTLQDSLERNSGLFKTLYGAHSTASIDTLQKLLAPTSAMISYAISDSTVYIIGIQKQRVTFRKTALQPHFADSVGRWVDLCRRPVEELQDIQTFARLGYVLYQTLLEPEILRFQDIDQLLLIPDGILGHIPFEALPMAPPAAETNGFGHLPYLLRSYRCYYAASATLWRDQQSIQFGTQALQCLGIAWGREPVNSLPGSREQIKGLQGTENELKTIQSIVNGKYFVAQEATEANFKAFAPQFDILHLALHARATETDPQILFPAAGNGQEDGILHFHELFPLHLRSRLAVLSACETGTGRLIQGEGIQSMSSGFAAAGVPSVLMSLWEVDDRAGGQIMQSFYEGIQKGLPIDESLEQAKLTYLENAVGFEAAPFYWSAMVPMGNMAPLRLAPPPTSAWWMISLGALSLLCIFILFRIYILSKRKTL